MMALQNYMQLKILLPFGVFAEVQNVAQVVAETSNGSYGFLPNRLDCTAKLKPGLFMYETPEQGKIYIALDEGIFVKKGLEVVVSSRNAIKGTDLGKLHEAIEKEFVTLRENEQDTRKVMAQLETNFIRNMKEMKKG